jgi:transposase
VDTKQRETSSRQRRRFSLEYKRRVVEETLSGPESVSVVARRHDLNTNLLFTWRRQYQRGALEGGTGQDLALVPIKIGLPACSRTEPMPQPEAELELMLASGHRVCVRGAVDPVMLRVALEVLSR